MRPFQLARYLADPELHDLPGLSVSDCEPLVLEELLDVSARDLVRRFERLSLGYTDPQGWPELRAAIADGYEHVEEEAVLIAASVECVHLVVGSLLRPGDHVICVQPTYQPLVQFADNLGCEITLWPAVESDGWRFDPEFLAAHLRDDTKLVITNFPHNPTGYLPSHEEWRRIVDLTSRRRAYLLSDEMFRSLEHDPVRRLPSAVDLYDRALVISGVSKAFGMGGVRIGWVICKEASMLGELMVHRDYTSNCANAPGQLLTLMALRAANGILRRNRDRIIRNVELFEAFVRRHRSKFSWTAPRAGTLSLPRLEDTSATEFCRRAARRGISVVPSTVFDYGDSHIRLGVGREDFGRLLERLEELEGENATRG